MIDLNQMASQRAKEIQQNDKDWVEAVRQPVFEGLCTRITDGEISMLIQHSPSPEVLLVCAGVFIEAEKQNVEEPLNQLVELTGKSSLGPAMEYLSGLARTQKNMSFGERLASVKRFLEQKGN